jgi:hypothetical protein
MNHRRTPLFQTFDRYIMYLSQIVLLALPLIGSATAAAIVKRVQTNTQSCSQSYKFFYTSYDVLIGVPYESSQCGTAYNAIENGAGELSSGDSNGAIWVTSWKCGEKDGFLHLSFNTPVGVQDALNLSLETTFPQIQGGFNC